MPDRIDTPVYARIALDLAGRIAAGEIQEGDRISGRSLLAGHYHVSPETIRRAVQLLEDIQIVEKKAGSGIIVLSRQQALQYVQRNGMIAGFRSIRDEIRQLEKEKSQLESRIHDLMEQLEEQAERLQNIRPVLPYEVAVPENSPIAGKTINESKFWQNTGGTIIAIQRGQTIIHSPGPSAIFNAGDILFITGESGVDLRSISYLKSLE